MSADMGGASVPPAEALLARRVQEMVLAGQEPLGPYLCRNEDDEDSEEKSTENSPIPVIDIGKCSAIDSEELEKLKSALSTWGCFEATGHGIPISFLDEVHRVGREFFKQPMEEKNKYAKTVTEFEGYGADPVPEEGQPLDWSDRLCLALVPEDRRNYRLWPQNPASFKTTAEELAEKMKSLTETVSKSMARSLHLEENRFLKQFGEGAQLDARLNYYSPCKRPDLVLGLKPHADGSGYTILMHDETGLQILNRGKWYTVPKSHDALLILMGDQMEIISNGIFKSPVHRVVSDPERDRLSLAVFYTPQVGKEVGPEEGLIDAETPRLFKMVKDYADIHWRYYQQGKRSLHTAKV